MLAVLSLPLFDYSPEGGAHHYGRWFFLALAIMVAWGLQAYFIKLANAHHERREHLLLHDAHGPAVHPGGLVLTDFSRPVNLGFSGPWLAAAIQMLNAVGALLLVYAFRYGKAIVVSPLVNAGAPLLTSLIALGVAGTCPAPTSSPASALALVGALLLSLQPE